MTKKTASPQPTSARAGLFTPKREINKLKSAPDAPQRLTRKPDERSPRELRFDGRRRRKIGRHFQERFAQLIKQDASTHSMSIKAQ